MLPNFLVISSPTIEWTKISNLTKSIVAQRKVWIERPPKEQALVEDPEFEVRGSKMENLWRKLFKPTKWLHDWWHFHENSRTLIYDQPVFSSMKLLQPAMK